MSKARMAARLATLEAQRAAANEAAFTAMIEWISAHTTDDQYCAVCRVICAGGPDSIEAVYKSFGQPQADDQAIYLELDALLPLEIHNRLRTTGGGPLLSEADYLAHRNTIEFKHFDPAKVGSA